MALVGVYSRKDFYKIPLTTGPGTYLCADQRLMLAPSMAEYDQTPAGVVRRGVFNGDFLIPDDADKIAQAMLDSASQHPAPLRLSLGPDTYAAVRAALVARLAALSAQQGILYRSRPTLEVPRGARLPTRCRLRIPLSSR